MANALARIGNFITANWESFVKLIDKLWAFLKETIFKDDSPFATTKGE